MSSTNFTWSTLEYYVPNMERRFSVLTFLSNEVQSIYIGAKLIRQTNAIISMKPYNYIWFIDRDEITDLDK